MHIDYNEIYVEITCSLVSGPSEFRRMGLHRLSSFIRLEFWKCATNAAFPCMRAYANDTTFSLLNFSHFFPLKDYLLLSQQDPNELIT
jgi:hypothetical protein